MKRRSKLRIESTIVLLAVVFLVSTWSQAGTTTAPTTMPMAATSTPTTQSAVDKKYEQDRVEARRLRVSGIERILAGRIDEGAAKIAASAKLDPNDPDNVAAYTLVTRYLAEKKKYDDQRAAEYAREVQRIHRAMLAQAHHDALADGESKPLEKKVTEIVTTFNQVGNGESLLQTTDDEAIKLKAQAAKDMDTLAKQVREAEKLVGDDDSEFSKTYRQLSAETLKKIEAYKKAWSKADVANDSARRASARMLRPIENELAQALTDLAGMANESPWQVALMHAQTAREIASPGVEITKEDWYCQLVKDVELRGQKAIADAEWRDAMRAYNGLKELDPNNEYYEERFNTASRHTRVLSLYGKPEKKAADTQPADDDEEIFWHELVKGVDADMARKAISQLHENYVTTVDYRKVAHGALTSLKILAETPQAAESFPLLKNDAKRKAFCDAIQKLLDNIEKRPRVDDLDLRLALSGALRASQRTVEIPPAVIALEFTDGMLDQLDKFSAMIWPYEVDTFEKQTLGQFSGIGVQITKEPDEPLKVVTPLADSPAFKAGIKTGDYIIAVEGRSTEKLTLDKLVDMIQGEKGSKVRLKIRRPGRPEPFDVEVVRDNVRVSTVYGWQHYRDGQWDFLVDPEAKVGYFRITQFTNETPEAVARILDQMKAAGVRSLVLDLRFDPGGLLNSATEVADEFLGSGTIVSTRGRQSRRTERTADRHGRYLDGDLVVLVNQYSASAAEILSGALKDWHRAIIVGERTYGKGSVQNLIPIHDHRALLKLTTAYYYLPTGRLLHRRNGSKTWGVDPDVAVILTPQQRKLWLTIRRNTDVIQEADPADVRMDLAEQYKADLPLQTAVLLLKLMQLQEPTPVVVMKR